MGITLTDLLILSLASFRLTRLFVFDKITDFIRKPFFDEIEEVNQAGESEIYLIPKQGGIRGFFGELLSCYWCTGVWTAIFLCFIYIVLPGIALQVIVVLAVAGLGAVFETIIQKFINN